MSYQSKKLYQFMADVSHNNMLLPALQREYTWKPQQIVTLIDSLMQEYPINTMMFWEVQDISKLPLDFYLFLDPNYLNNSSEDKSTNTLLNSDGKKRFQDRPVNVVIDGQQRITSLYIALYGSYNGKKLYLNLDHEAPADNGAGMKFDLRFLTEDDAEKLKSKGENWIKVNEVASSNFSAFDYLVDHGLKDNKVARKALEQLEKMYKASEINYYLISGNDDIDSVLDIFVRTNSGGKPLTKGDLLLSSLTTDWAKGDESTNARLFVEGIIKNVKDLSFCINKDWVLKCFLVLKDSSLKMTVATFKQEHISGFVFKNKDAISDSINKAFTLVRDFGLQESALTTKLAVIPIAYYIFKNNLQGATFNDTTRKEDFYAMRKYLFCAILNNLFAGQSDNKLQEVRAALRDKSSFTLETFKRPSEINMTDERIKELLQTQKKDAFPLLNIIHALGLKPLDSGKQYDVDHIFPVKQCKTCGVDKSVYDTVPNLELLESSINRSKNAKDVAYWTGLKNDDERVQWHANNFIPTDAVLEIDEINDFVKKRSGIFEDILEKLKPNK